MPEGFRPAFYEENAKLQSIELLAWAAARPCFIASEMQTAFTAELAEHKDPAHEIQERLRKLISTGMIRIADMKKIDTLDLDPVLKGSIQARVESLKIDRSQKAVGSDNRKHVGRFPRVYFITSAGSNQVERRANDLKEIAKKRLGNNTQG